MDLGGQESIIGTRLGRGFVVGLAIIKYESAVVGEAGGRDGGCEERRGDDAGQREGRGSRAALPRCRHGRIQAVDQPSAEPGLEARPSDTTACRPGRGRGEHLPVPQAGHAVVDEHGDVLIACLTPEEASALFSHWQLPDSVKVQEVPGVPVYRKAWDLLNWLSEALADDLEAEPFSPNAADRAECAGEHPVSIDDSAVVFPGVVFDTHAGPIFIGPGVTIRPNAVLVGPCWIARESVISEGAVIRGNTVVGPHCRVGGEVGASIFQGWSNKVHDGYLGDSLVGQWVNIGAGTVTSNLLNTYGEISIRLEPEGPRQRSGRMFLGTLFGDHVKTAIGTRLMTGTVLGTASMIASSTPPPSIVSRFAWLTDDGQRLYRLDKFIQMVRLVMSRRDQELTDADEAVLRALHDTTSTDS